MKILHLYHDLMNLYGDYANLSALCKILNINGIEYTVEKKSLGDTLKLSKYDFIFIGSGSEENQKLALSHLVGYGKELKDYIENGGFALLTGNSFEMLGRSISGFLGEFEGLGIFDFETVEQNKRRLTADAVFGCELVSCQLVGFTNKCSYIKGITTPLFSVVRGDGNDENDAFEGILYKNLFGTHLTGPVLVKNPHFLEAVASKLVGASLNSDAFAYEKKAYEMAIDSLLG